MRTSKQHFVWILVVCLSACGGGGGDSVDNAGPGVVNLPPPDDAGGANNNSNIDDLDTDLRALIEAEGIIGDAAFNRTLPSVNDPLAQLGKVLFFSKSLSGDFDVACVSCHHPMLGGADELSLPIGTQPRDPDVLGVGRVHAITGIPNVPRNSPTVFNAGLWDQGMFLDSRVESLGKEEHANGTVSDIRTPDSDFAMADIDAGLNLPSAQARFPVTSPDEMRGSTFAAGAANDDVRNHLAARLGNYGVGSGELAQNEWLSLFQQGFESNADATTLITFNNIATALGEYERSMVFTSNPFSDYVLGDSDALTDAQKRGAILFFTPSEEGGGGCSNCHSGDRFTDESHHVVAFAQIGPGKGDADGVANDDDFGRERETGNAEQRYHFRTPSLLNVAVTAPYGHSGAYASLDTVLDHYDNAGQTVAEFFDDGGVCELPQFQDIAECADLYPNSETNSLQALAKLDEERRTGTASFTNTNLNGRERDDIVDFLESLTDPCVLDRDCMAPWIAAGDTLGPDGQQLNALDAQGNLL